jgi:hypothetical protein
MRNAAGVKSMDRERIHLFLSTLVSFTTPFLYMSLAVEWDKRADDPNCWQTWWKIAVRSLSQMCRFCVEVGC